MPTPLRTNLWKFLAACILLFSLFSPGRAAQAQRTPANIQLASVSGLQVVKISATSRYTCALTVDSKVLCWGFATFYQYQYGPMEVPGLPDHIVDIATGDNFICILVESVGVECWGYNGNGELGNGTAQMNPPIATPAPVIGLDSDVKSIAAGYSSACALLDSGSVKCWGANMYGQLGDGTKIDRYTAVDVQGLVTPVRSLSSGPGPFCAINANGALQCWGYNGNGQLGTGDKAEYLLPQTVTGLESGVRSVATGGLYTCALLVDGAVKCWGNLYYYMPGYDPNQTEQLTPTAIGDLPANVQTIAASGTHVCVATADGKVYCWGTNQYGQIGDGTTTDRPNPVQITGLPQNIVALSLGSQHSCALGSDSKIWCWGRNWSGQIGDGTPIQQFAPVAVDQTNPRLTFAAIAARSLSSCGITPEGEVACWGIGAVRSSVDGRLEDSSRPTPVQGLASRLHDVQIGYYFGCGLTAAGGVKCWGSSATGNAADDIPGMSQGVVGLAVGHSHVCALMDTGGVKCWGDNRSGQLGDGTTQVRADPVDVVGLSSGVARIAAGEVHTCAIMQDGSAKCWGSNAVGQLGNGTTVDSLTPVSVTGLSAGFTELTAGDALTCAWKASGANECWGAVWHGELGASVDGGIQTTPAPITGITGSIRSLAIGFGHVCVVGGDGSLRCWGNNEYGQLGDRSTNNRQTPKIVPGLSQHVVSVAAGDNHTCALLDDGSARCWGSNKEGQVGDGAPLSITTPSQVVGLDMQPAFFLRHVEGAPGSQFTLIGVHYPMNANIAVYANGKELGTLTANYYGYFSLVLDTENADDGQYKITIVSGPAQAPLMLAAAGSNVVVTTSASTLPSLTLDSSLPIVDQDGGGSIFHVPAGIARYYPAYSIYLPSIRR